MKIFLLILVSALIINGCATLSTLDNLRMTPQEEIQWSERRLKRCEKDGVPNLDIAEQALQQAKTDFDSGDTESATKFARAARNKSFQARMRWLETELPKRPYQDNLYNTKSLMGANKFLVSLFLEMHSGAWRHAIERGRDFNQALANQKEALQDNSVYQGMHYMHKEIQIYLQALKKPPPEHKDVYNLLLELYSIYSQLYDFAISPSGSLSTFNRKILDLDSEYTKAKSKLEIFLPPKE